MPCRHRLVALCWVVMAIGTAAAQDCPTLIDVPCTYNRAEGFVQFGLRPDGVVVSVGQTVTLDCATRILGIELQFYRAIGLWEGDPIHVAVMSVDAGVRHAEILQPMPVFSTWDSVYFDLSAVSPRLDPGVYLIGATPEVPRGGGLAYCRVGDAYAGGGRMISHHGLDGPWSDYPGLDLRFRLHLEPPPVAVTTVSWGRLRAWYR